MEPSGRNQWQLVANRTAPKIAQTSENRCHRVATVWREFHGRRGRPFECVRGLSTKCLLQRDF
jgi:hypothetical protein